MSVDLRAFLPNPQNQTNVFAADAAAAAYSEGGEWLDDLREYLWENKAV